MSPSRPRITVVDDDGPVRKALRRLLLAAGLDADACASGQEFFDSLRVRLPDCVVLDLQMPEMSGLDVLRQLARAGVRLPVVVITGHDEPGGRSRCLSAGAAAYLRKPLEETTLLNAIATAIGSAAP